jgi:BirA family biotin operon repressor/biotin-[acetyl-CoA-carboxylase] ligase
VTEPHHGEQAIPGQGDTAHNGAAGPFSDPVRLPEVDSTNRYAVDAARDGAAEGLVVLAEVQTAGRGRRGRRWRAPAGSAVLCSLLFRPPFGTADLHLLPTLVAVAAKRACFAAAGVEVSLKWPNDLVAGRRKLAGVLAEVVPESYGGTGRSVAGLAVVVGVGINVTWPAPAPAPAPAAGDVGHFGVGDLGEEELAAILRSATSLVAEAPAWTPVREPVVEALVSNVNELYGELVGRPASELPALHLSRRSATRLMAEYRAACATIGARVRVDLADESFEGTALDITDQGALLVSTRACIRTVEAGDVVHLRPATNGEGE